jgi:dipeptidyl aminopeptidase/acylaminoacyl peptidase
MQPRSIAVLALSVLALTASAQTKRPIALADHSRIKAVADPQRSPDGQWVAYTVTTIDEEKDKRDSNVWMVRWDGGETLQLTSSPDNESSPRWSPDGKYLSFLAARGTEEEKKKGAQVWLLPRAGGEAMKLTDVKGGVSDYSWSPDSARLAFVASDPDPDDEPEKKEGWKRKTAPPIVIDRYHFKQDRQGYLKRLYRHIAVFDIGTRTATTITSGSADDSSPSWSPDGRRIAFLSKRAHPDPDRTSNEDLFVVEARAGAEPKRLTNTPEGEGGRPAWSPDGSRIAILVGDDDRNTAYSLNKLGIVPADAPEPLAPRLLTTSLDRAVSTPIWSADGSTIAVLLQDDRTQQIVNVPSEGPTAARPIRRLTDGRGVISAIHSGPLADGNFAALRMTPMSLPEVWAVAAAPPRAERAAGAPADGEPRRLTRHNQALLDELQLATTEDFTSKSKDGTEVHGLLVKPAGFVAGRRYPTIVHVHGGPNGQDQHSFSFDREWFAANGYVVLAVNYRGSAGRGQAYQKAIHHDWGNLEVMDVLGAVDEAVRQGIADPDRLGIGGWSYGGITTDYAIATDPRFKAAVSGAGSGLWLSLYGVDQYIIQYDQELGQPWTARERWMKLSYPFFNVDKIKTPTLFLGGEKDFNVPLAGGEQMYQALKSLGVETQLVIYPGQFHGLTIPSYERDRLQRYVEWFDRHLKAAGTVTARR